MRDAVRPRERVQLLDVWRSDGTIGRASDRLTMLERGDQAGRGEQPHRPLLVEVEHHRLVLGTIAQRGDDAVPAPVAELAHAGVAGDGERDRVPCRSLCDRGATRLSTARQRPASSSHCSLVIVLAPLRADVGRDRLVVRDHDDRRRRRQRGDLGAQHVVGGDALRREPHPAPAAATGRTHRRRSRRRRRRRRSSRTAGRRPPPRRCTRSRCCSSVERRPSELGDVVAVDEHHHALVTGEELRRGERRPVHAARQRERLARRAAAPCAGRTAVRDAARPARPARAPRARPRVGSAPSPAGARCRPARRARRPARQRRRAPTVAAPPTASARAREASTSSRVRSACGRPRRRRRRRRLAPSPPVRALPPRGRCAWRSSFCCCGDVRTQRIPLAAQLRRLGGGLGGDLAEARHLGAHGEDLGERPLRPSAPPPPAAARCGAARAGRSALAADSAIAASCVLPTRRAGVSHSIPASSSSSGSASTETVARNAGPPRRSGARPRAPCRSASGT